MSIADEVAIEVMGWRSGTSGIDPKGCTEERWWKPADGKNYVHGRYTCLRKIAWLPDRDISDAWLVVLAVQARGYLPTLCGTYERCTFEWNASFENRRRTSWYDVDPNPCVAICRAALKTVRAETSVTTTTEARLL